MVIDKKVCLGLKEEKKSLAKPQKLCFNYPSCEQGYGFILCLFNSNKA